jgi:hypothetical protein
MPKTYTLESYIQVGYFWTVTAPESINAEQVEVLTDALADYADYPCQEEYEAMLANKRYLSDFFNAAIPLPKESDLALVTIEAEEKKYRDVLTQSFTEVTK